MDIIVIGNGLPKYNLQKSFNVSASDASKSIIDEAEKNITLARHQYNIRAIDLRNCNFAELRRQDDWRSKFDLVIAPNAINQLSHGLDVTEYDNYLVDSLIGLKSVIKKNGTLMLDSRDWQKTFDAHYETTMRKMRTKEFNIFQNILGNLVIHPVIIMSQKWLFLRKRI